jgi:hypothetical protein
MEGIFWNCNGFADVNKYRFLAELIKEKSLDFIALSKTGRVNIPQTTLNNICAGRDFIWHCKSPHGGSGGMLLGINLVTSDIGEIEEGEFFIRFKLRNKENDFKFIWCQYMGRCKMNIKKISCLRLCVCIQRKPYLLF